MLDTDSGFSLFFSSDIFKIYLNWFNYIFEPTAGYVSLNDAASEHFLYIRFAL